MSALDEIKKKSVERMTNIEWAINRIFLSGFEETAKNAADEFAGLHEQIEVCKGGKEVIDELRKALDEARALFREKEFVPMDSGLYSRTMCIYCRGTIPNHHKKCRLAAWLAARPKE